MICHQAIYLLCAFFFKLGFVLFKYFTCICVCTFAGVHRGKKRAMHAWDWVLGAELGFLSVETAFQSYRLFEFRSHVVQAGL